MAVISGLDGSAIRMGAGCVLFVLLPAYVVLQIVSGGDADSDAWVFFVFALAFAAMFGGYAAARDRPPRPLVHGTVASALGLAVALGAGLLLQAVQGDLSGAQVLTAVVFLYIGACLGLLGGLLAVKGTRPS